MELNVTSDLFGIEFVKVATYVIYQCNLSCSNATKPIVFTINYRSV